MGGEKTSILTVCTGNICRSPLAEFLIRQIVRNAGSDVEVSSAGVGALIGGSPPREIVEQGAAWGLDITRHKPRQLEAPSIQDATLILAAERAHRAAVVEMVPAASRKTFTLKQFARITENYFSTYDINSFEKLSLAAFVEEVADHRALTPPPATPEHDDVPDPYRRSQSVYDLSADEIRKSIAALQRFFEGQN